MTKLLLAEINALNLIYLITLIVVTICVYKVKYCHKQMLIVYTVTVYTNQTMYNVIILTGPVPHFKTFSCQRVLNWALERTMFNIVHIVGDYILHFYPHLKNEKRL